MSGFSGMKAWLIQRFTGIYIAIVAVTLAMIIWLEKPTDYQQWSALFSGRLYDFLSHDFLLSRSFGSFKSYRKILL